jgi:CRP/FNR family cyclic AMP-dependent transcriptional regulator
MQPDPKIIQTMQAIPWFRDLEPAMFEKLAHIAGIVDLAKGEPLFNEGDKEDFVYIVINGRIGLEIFVPARGRIRIETAEPMDLVGWSSVTPVVRQRTAGARAVIDSRLLSLDAEKLRALCDEDHDLGYHVMRRIANIIASRLMVTRLQLLDIFAHPSEVPHVE